MKLTDKSIKFRGICIFSVLAVLIISVIIIMVKSDLEKDILKYATHVGDNGQLQIIEDFVSDMKIKQEFSCYNDFDFITLSFSDHDRTIEGKTFVTVQDKNSNELLYYKEIDNGNIHYGTPVEISFREFGGGKAENRYVLTLVSEGTGQVALGVYGYESDVNQAFINDKKSDYVLSIGMHSYTNAYKNLTKVILGIAAVSIFCVIAGTFVFKVKEQQMFLLLAIPFGMCMLLFLPSNKVYDEARHYHTIYHYSNIILGDADDDTATSISMRKTDIINKQNEIERQWPVNGQAQDYWYNLQKITQKSDVGSMEMVDISDFPVVGNSSALEYLPGIIGMVIGRLLTLNHFWMLMMTKSFLFAFYLFMCYHAIRIAPVLKMGMVFTAALPMALYQATGITYDSFTFAVGFVVFSFLLKVWISGLSKNEWLLFEVFVFLLGGCKGGVYLTIIILLVFMPKDNFFWIKWKTFLLTAAVAGISLMFFFMPVFIAWFSIGSQVPATISNVEKGTYEIAFATHHPVEFLGFFVRTLINKSDIYFGEILGYRTAWSNKAINMSVMMPFFSLLLLASIKMKRREQDIGIKMRAGIFVLLAIEMLGLHVIFLVETPIYSDIVQGFQGRYFMMFIPCIMLMFRNNKLSFNSTEDYLYPCYSMAQMFYLYFFIKMFMCD